MARSDSSSSSHILRPVLFERFRTEEHQEESRHYDGIGVRELKASVARNLEWLLNTRTWAPPEADDFKHLQEARESLLTYGIRDLSAFSWTSAGAATKISSTIEEAIRRFEPRLLARTVKCHIIPNEDPSDFALNFCIEAVLYVDPISEHVAFDSAADIDGCGITIENFE